LLDRIPLGKLVGMKSDWITITIPATNRDWGACYQWCMDAWGRNNAWVYMGPGKFHFKNSSDAMFFKLKWL
jgi:hypothetical protein